MFNAGAFNRQAFNRVPSFSDVVHMSIALAATMGGWARTGADSHGVQRWSVNLSGNSILSSGMPMPVRLVADLHGGGTGSANIHSQIHVSAILAGGSALGANKHASIDLAGALLGSSSLGGDRHMPQAFIATLVGIAYPAANRHVSQVWYATLNGYAGAFNTEEIVMRITEEIPPGGTLVVDSEFYNVLLGGVDRVDIHQGEWIGINRETSSLTLSTAGGTCVWEVFFIARYL